MSTDGGKPSDVKSPSTMPVHTRRDNKIIGNCDVLDMTKLREWAAKGKGKAKIDFFGKSEQLPLESEWPRRKKKHQGRLPQTRSADVDKMN